MTPSQVDLRSRRTAADQAGIDHAPGKWFRRLCWDNSPFCIRCHEKKVYTLKDDRYRCPSCGYTFHDFTGRFIGRCALGPEAWLGMLHHFAAGDTARRTAATLGTAYNTAHKALTTIRLALAATSPDARSLLDQDMELMNFCPDDPAPEPGEHCRRCRSPVFALADTGSGVRFVHLPDLRPREVMTTPLAKNQWLVFLYTDRFQEYDSLIFSCCRFARRDFKPGMALGSVHLDRRSIFWSFAKPLLARYHCITPQTTPLYLKEMEFRFNHRHADLLPLVARHLCALMPDHEY